VSSTVAPRLSRIGRGSWGVLVALGVLAGCAPTTVSPMVMRMGPGRPDNTLIQAGLRSGPRLSSPLAAQERPGQPFSGNRNIFSTQQWSVAYDFSLQKPLTEKLALHLGVNGEVYYPLPLPGYGLYMGLSSWYGTPNLGVAPALVVRGASDFGIETRGGPGHMAGVETSATFYFTPEERVCLGFVPFLGVHHVISLNDRSATTLYYGGALVMQVPLGRKDRLEFSGGFGQVKTPGEQSWNSPIFGARWGR
jgi:hypothetical protein